MIEIGLLIIVCLLIYHYCTATFRYWKQRSVPFVKPTALFGNYYDVVSLKTSPAACHESIYRNFPNEKYVGMFQLRTPALLIRCPEMVKQILVKDFNHFMDRGFHADEEREPITAHLVNLQGEKWRMLRQKISPVFTSGKLKAMFPLLETCSSQLSNYIESALGEQDSSLLEMRDVMAGFTTDVIGSVAFGLHFNSFTEKESDFQLMGRRVLDSSQTSVITKAIRVFFPQLFHFLRLRTFPEEIATFFQTVIHDTIENREKNDVQRNDFIQLLMQLRKKSPDYDGTEANDLEITESVIAAQAFVFFMAGYETSSTTLSFCLYELAKNLDVQEKACNEIKKVLNKHGKLSHEALMDLDYLEMILLETMRKYPPVSVLARVCTKPYTIPGTKISIDPGTSVAIPVYSFHHDHKYFPDPETFDPERFSKENQEKSINYTYLPFGDGPRVCIGLRFAMLEMKLGLSDFLLRYKVSRNAQSTQKIEFDPGSFITAPRHGLKVLVERRTEDHIL
uniref:Cytochrome P450 CYP6AY1v2 n=1 Tax=Nilaparvata lugens TaxID=108931 RepID=A0A4D7AQ12_NILLU|nr:cytochrome P450 CYP6AY1v2 [Nilaparvata lugens]